jgi:hypothetical protein
MSAYSRHVYLPAKAPKLDALIDSVKARFPSAAASKSGGALLLTFGDWTMRIVDYRKKWVREEAQELAERAPREAQAALRAATHRLELYDSGDPDADDEHFNDGLIVWEHFLRTPGAVGLDPVAGLFQAGLPPKAPSAKSHPKRPSRKARAPIEKPNLKRRSPRRARR